MSKVVLRTENLSKRYRLGVINRRMLYQEIQSRWARWRGKEDPNAPILTDAHHRATKSGFFDALREVSFDIHEGEAVAIIGRNGAGKSTLLKILSQITAPSSGRVLMKGRVASLLEVGTGFHPELTGRENVYLNGAILGMTKRDIARKFDEIAAFSGVEEFLDTPVKRYSSGMSVRLAFAVAAHLEPEILIIDEVLAVGDATFQQKCLGKIGEVAGSGRTVLFVSHNTAAVQSLCRRGVVLDEGRLVFDGTQMEALQKYAESYSVGAMPLRHRGDRKGSGEIRIAHIEMHDAKTGGIISAAQAGQDIELRLYYARHIARAFPRLNVRINVLTNLGSPVFTQSNNLTGHAFPDAPDKGVFVCRLRELPLPAGTYRLDYYIQTDLSQGDTIEHMENAFELNVNSGDFFGTGALPSQRAGLALVKAEWRVEEERSSGAGMLKS